MHPTEAPGHAVSLARGLAESHDVVVAVGGDGTVQEVVRGLVGTEAALGVVPFGTGNDLAHALGMPTRLPDALAVFAGASTEDATPLDVGRLRWTEDGSTIHERLFANAIGTGFDALVATTVPRFKRLGGNAAYLAAVLKTLRIWGKREIEVDIRLGDAGTGARFGLAEDGELFYSGPFFLCEVGNGHSVGGGFLLTPDAVPDDGAFDVCLARPLTLRRIARVLPLAMKAKHTREPEVSFARAGRIAIRAASGTLPIQADGEVIAEHARELDADILPGAIRAFRGPGSDRR